MYPVEAFVAFLEKLVLRFYDYRSVGHPTPLPGPRGSIEEGLPPLRRAPYLNRYPTIGKGVVGGVFVLLRGWIPDL